MTVRRLLDELDSRELTEWMAWYRFHHLSDDPEFRADLRSGIVAASTINAAGPRKAVKPDDLMPKFERAQQSDEQLHAALNARADADAARAKRAAGRKAATDEHDRGSVGQTRVKGQGLHGRTRPGRKEGE